MRLTKSAAAKVELPPGKAELIVFDDGLKGFGLRVRAGGKRSWICQYRVGKKQRRLGLGQFEAVDADEARRRAKEALAKVSLGEDPAAVKAEVTEPRKTTMGAALPVYLKWAESRHSPKHHALAKSYLEKYWLALHDTPLAEIDRARVSEQFPIIAAEHGPITANRCRTVLSKFFSWAVGEGLAPHHAVQGTNVPVLEVQRERRLTDEELRLVWQNCEQDEFGTIIKLLILTAARRDEIAGMGWSEMDGPAFWTLPAERSKNKMPLLVPLPPTAVSLIAAVPRRAGRDMLFGRVGPFSGFGRAKTNLEARMMAQRVRENGPKVAPVPPWTIHDLRRTTATGLGDLKVPPHVVECVLNHISGFRGGVGGRYNKSLYLEDKAEALVKWNDHVLKIVGA